MRTTLAVVANVTEVLLFVAGAVVMIAAVRVIL